MAVSSGLVFAAIACSSLAHADTLLPDDAVELHQQRAVFSQLEGMVQIGVSVKNVTDGPLASIIVSCDALDNDENLLDNGLAEIINVRPGVTQRTFVDMPSTTDPKLRFDCRVTRADPPDDN
ncbi:MAG: hypothetical protein P4M09_17080 [Devosia sp.]|nr:hypothetical protein [Devosia sp.]